MGTLISVIKNDDGSLDLEAGRLYEITINNGDVIAEVFNSDDFMSLRKDCINNLDYREKRLFDKSDDCNDIPIGLSEIALKSILKANGLKLNIQLYCLALNLFNYGFYLGEIASKKEF
ncbi:hypothetical protein HKO22_09655 [Peptoniphilus sp. AGMB00490]|uniref:Uncharacterized protein n=1 Tax=Peptoniphilus faecalis TaxID=2731255 RepID=A0A848R9I9_9FIRM|nr:hypothetical protein [Peptoniphilus faecalis]NMW85987.1 hypothetical protein [Peptoniphilus faecalis]